MNASVIIPTHNRKSILSSVLHYYTLQVRTEDPFELVIVDDGSTDGTSLLFKSLEDMNANLSTGNLKDYGERIVSIKQGQGQPSSNHAPYIVRYIKIEKSGRSVARNIGIVLSTNPLIIFADDDIFVEPEFIRKHIQAHGHNDKRVVQGRVIHTGDLKNPLSARWKPRDINTAFLSTGNASILKKHIVQAGMFDDSYSIYGWEDFDLGIHLKENGIASIRRPIYGYHFDPHKRALTPQETYQKERERGFSAVYFYKNHPLRWVKRFTLLDNRFLRFLFHLLGRDNWFLSKKRISFLKGILKLIIRYKGYYDGIEEGKKYYKM